MEITLLDGGMGQELIARSDAPATPLWSTDVMRATPDLVRAVHADYFTAGAEVATANTYAIHRDRLVKAGVEDEFEALHRLALAQARAARDAHGGGLVAGAIGPLGGSYRPDLQPEHGAAVALFAEVAALQAPLCDLLICESVASVAHARAALEGALGHDVPVWIGFTVDDRDGSRLRSGEPLAEAVAVCGGAAALLANCSIPEAMPAALAALAKAGLPFGAYANGFTEISAGFLEDSPTVDALSARADLGPATYADHVMEWVAQGATIIGGCCEVGPAHIAEISRRLDALP